MKFYRFRYSPFARKVQIVLDLIGAKVELIEVPYSDRDELARVTGGYIQVPVLVDDDGTVTVDSRAICEKLVRTEAGQKLVPAPWQGPVWAYTDYIDTTVEDVLFKVASPTVRDAWKTAGDRALYTFVKERKFGAGCVDAWLRDRESLCATGQKLLRPTLETLEARPFLFGDAPTLADAALYGQCMMLEEADTSLLPRISPALRPFMRRVEAKVSR